MTKFFSALLLVLMLAFSSYADEPESNDKRAILIVSFGTSMPEARKAIDNLFDAAKNNFPDYEIKLAFTSNIIRRKIAREENLNIQNPVQALAELNDSGFKKVYVIPTHIIPGEEYDEIKNVVEAFRTLSKYGFKEIKLARPFLNNYKDCEAMAEILISRFKDFLEKNSDTAVILMGHGTPEHPANALYALLQLALNNKMPNRIFLGTVESAPSIDDILLGLKNNLDIKKLVLSPFMIVAGDHANNDLAGEDDEESWLNILKKNGYANITTYLHGMGEDEKIADMFIKKLNALINED